MQQLSLSVSSFEIPNGTTSSQLSFVTQRVIYAVNPFYTLLPTLMATSEMETGGSKIQKVTEYNFHICKLEIESLLTLCEVKTTIITRNSHDLGTTSYDD